MSSPVSTLCKTKPNSFSSTGMTHTLLPVAVLHLPADGDARQKIDLRSGKSPGTFIEAGLLYVEPPFSDLERPQHAT
jgi:hypothetical protein